LSIGAIFAGYFFKETFIGHNYKEFWKTSIFFIKEIEHLHLPIWLLVITPILVIFAIPLAYYLYVKNSTLIESIKKTNEPFYNFLLNKWYFDEIYDFIIVKPVKFIGLVLWKKGDQGTIDRFGPDGFSKIIKFFSNKAVKFQSGFLYDYAFVMLLGLSILLTYLIVA